MNNIQQDIEMVDIEDVINNEPIYSKLMLSFISEQFNIWLENNALYVDISSKL